MWRFSFFSRLRDSRLLRKYNVTFLCQWIFIKEKIYFANCTNRIQNEGNEIKINHQIKTEECSPILLLTITLISFSKVQNKKK
jgi:hypothetical protein